MAVKSPTVDHDWNKIIQKVDEHDTFDTVNELMGDFDWATTQYCDNDSPPARRALVRSFFAMIEGVVWSFKQTCLAYPEHMRKKTLTTGDLALLSDESYELDRKGKLQIKSKHVRLADNLRYTFKIMSDCFGTPVLQGGSGEFTRLEDGIHIRNKITHPKNAKDLEITKAEIKEIVAIWNWLKEPVIDSLKAISALKKAVGLEAIESYRRQIAQAKKKN